MCGYKLAFMNATPSCLTVDLTRTKDFPEFGKNWATTLFFHVLNSWSSVDLEAKWEKGPERALEIWKVDLFPLLQCHTTLDLMRFRLPNHASSRTLLRT